METETEHDEWAESRGQGAWRVWRNDCHHLESKGPPAWREALKDGSPPRLQATARGALRQVLHVSK